MCCIEQNVFDMNMKIHPLIPAILGFLVLGLAFTLVYQEAVWNFPTSQDLTVQAYIILPRVCPSDDNPVIVCWDGTIVANTNAFNASLASLALESNLWSQPVMFTAMYTCSALILDWGTSYNNTKQVLDSSEWALGKTIRVYGQHSKCLLNPQKASQIYFGLGIAFLCLAGFFTIVLIVEKYTSRNFFQQTITQINHHQSQQTDLAVA